MRASGIAEVWDALTTRWDTLRDTRALDRARAAQARDWLWAEVRDGMAATLATNDEVRALEASVVAGEISAARAAHRLLAAQRAT